MHTLTAPAPSGGSPTARTRRRRRARTTLVAVVAVIVATIFAAMVVVPALVRPDSPGARPGPVIPGAGTGTAGDDGPWSPFDEDAAAIANLDPALRAAVQDAYTAADADGFEFFVESGWRSASDQQTLFDEAVRTYGSVGEAERYVSSPDRSHHVSGEAVDVGPTDAMSWLQQHGIDYGLCQTYGNEMWHWELAATPGGECPAQLSDAGAG